jgi:hypothetical protein
VTNGRRQRIVSQLAEQGALSPGRLCDVGMSVTAMTGAGIMLRSSGASLGSVGMTNAVSALIEELQFMLGEGPCIDAYNLEVPIAEPDLTDPMRRWPGFTPPVLKAGVKAIFSFPLQAGAVCLGALDLYRDQSGPLSDDQHADALVLADVVAESVLTMQADALPGTLSSELTHVTEGLNVVHQAAGMVSAQLAVSVDDALVWLKAHAFANDYRISDLARDVVERRVRFDPANGAGDSTS